MNVLYKGDTPLATIAPKDASELPYSNGVSVKDKIDEVINYSTTERVIGKWVNGKPLYAKTINCGALPNNSVKGVAHDISNFKNLIYAEGFATNGTNSFDLPHIYVSGGSVKGVQITVGAAYISITTMENLTEFNESFITLKYTKTTD